jgi:hypothetical protein
MNILNSISVTVSFLLIWLNTEAFVYYGRLFKLSKFLKIDEFDQDKLNDFTLEYPTWLVKKYNSFFTKLITCPWCIGFWVTLISCLFLGTLNLFPTVYLISMTIYFIITNKIL